MLCLPYEVSVARSPAFEDVKILGVGGQALRTWRILTERRIVADWGDAMLLICSAPVPTTWYA
jgi:hypothetical protein